MADKPKLGLFGKGWRILTIGGLLIGVAALFAKNEERISALGRPTAPPSAESLKEGYEVKDINVRRTVYILAGMGATTALVIGIVFVMIWRFNVNRRAAWAHLTPQQTATLVPPAPHVPRDPFAQLARVRAREERQLHSYGWVSADHSLAHIPIGRAMALVVGKSLDVTP